MYHVSTPYSNCHGKTAMVLKMMRGWVGDLGVDAYDTTGDWYQGLYNGHQRDTQTNSSTTGPKLDWSEYKIIEFQRHDAYATCLSLIVSRASGAARLSFNTLTPTLSSSPLTLLATFASCSRCLPRRRKCRKDRGHRPGRGQLNSA